MGPGAKVASLSGARLSPGSRVAINLNQKTFVSGSLLIRPKKRENERSKANLANDGEDFEISFDDIARLNGSLELNCALQAHVEAELHSDDSHCPTSFDSILCWPRTAAGQISLLPCLGEFKGIHYDKSRKFNGVSKTLTSPLKLLTQI